MIKPSSSIETIRIKAIDRHQIRELDIVNVSGTVVEDKDRFSNMYYLVYNL